jgi:hypothetical protein
VSLEVVPDHDRRADHTVARAEAHIDYLWLIKGDFYQLQDVKKLIEELRHVELVQLVSLLDLREIKNKMNLIF